MQLGEVAQVWVIFSNQDFGGLKELKAWLADKFDHKVLVAEDDPYLRNFSELHSLGALDLVVLPTVGCEAFVILIKEMVLEWLRQPHNAEIAARVKLSHVKVAEHESNYAFWYEALETA